MNCFSLRTLCVFRKNQCKKKSRKLWYKIRKQIHSAKKGVSSRDCKVPKNIWIWTLMKHKTLFFNNLLSLNFLSCLCSNICSTAPLLIIFVVLPFYWTSETQTVMYLFGVWLTRHFSTHIQTQRRQRGRAARWGRCSLWYGTDGEVINGQKEGLRVNSCWLHCVAIGTDVGMLSGGGDSEAALYRMV